MSTLRTVGRANLMGAGFGSVRLPVSAALATILASICLGSSFLTGAWFFPATFAVLATVGGAELARRLSAPRSFVPVAAAVALLLYLVLVYARDAAYLWIVPNREALLQLQDLVTDGRRDISRFAAPIAVSPGIEFLAAAGVGAVALAVDTLAVTMRRAALAGLPLLVLYTVPTTVAPGGVGWLAFALGGVGYLTLLLAEARERVSRWGRPMRYSVPRPNWRPDVETAPLAQIGRRVGAAALGLALVIPAVLPDFDASTFGFGGNGFGNGPGHGRKVNVVNPIIDLGKDLRQGENEPVISYTGKPDYLRLVGLDLFDGDKWDPSPSQVSNRKNDVREGLVSAPGLSPNVPTKVRNRSFKIFDLEETWLPLPYPTRKVSSLDGKWLYDESTFNVFPFNGSTRQISYEARSLEVSLTAERLRDAGTPPDAVAARYTQLPPDVPGTIVQAANDVTKGVTTPFDKAVLLQQWLRSSGNFVYNTHVADTLGDANGLTAIARFIDTRQGYCVHFASTMAVMARQLNIPARVAVGFTPGRFDKKTGRNIVTLHDAHAWPELYFQGAGWVRFEPTPAGGRTPEPGFTQNANIGSDSPTTPGQSPTTAASGGDAPVSARAKEEELLAAQGNAAPKPTGPVAIVRQEVPLLPVGLTLGVLLVGLVPLGARTWVRRRRWRRATSPAALAAATWGELLDTLLDYGYEWPASDPPRRGAIRLAEARGFTGETYDALGRLAAATERARYATELGAVGDLRSDLATIRATLSADAGRGARLRARFLPRSARAVSTALSEQLADALDALDSLGTRLRPRRTAG